jgi:hypothetical protein
MEVDSVRSHLAVRLAGAAALLAGGMAGAVATASPAAAKQQCQSYELYANYGVSSTPSANVFVNDVDYCEPGPGGNVSYPVTISKYVGGTGWVVVASGSGSTDYTCTGGQFLYTTSVTTAQSKPAFYCG